MKNCKYCIRKVFITSLTMMMLLTLLPNVAFASMADGDYKISVEAWNLYNNAPSMADQYLEETAKLEVTKGIIHANIVMSESDLLKDFSVMGKSGEFELAQVVTENKSTNEKTYRFKVNNLDEPVQVQTFVTPAGMTVTFRIAFDKGSMEKIESKPAQQSSSTPKPEQSSNTGNTPASSGSSSGNTSSGTSSQSSNTTPPPSIEQSENENITSTEEIEEGNDADLEEEEHDKEEDEEEEASTVDESEEDAEGKPKSKKYIFLLLFLIGVSLGGYIVYKKKIKVKA